MDAYFGFSVMAEVPKINEMSDPLIKGRQHPLTQMLQSQPCRLMPYCKEEQSLCSPQCSCTHTFFVWVPRLECMTRDLLMTLNTNRYRD